MEPFTAFDIQDLPAFETEAKVGLLATVTPQGLPHLTLITSLQAKDPRTLVFGQFSEGRSKHHVADNPRAGFLIMTMDRHLWRGQATWTHTAREGDDYEMFNRKPMFRYNAYFGIHTVHYLDLVSTFSRESLPLGSILPAAILTRLAGKKPVKGEPSPVMTAWAANLFDALTTLKFIAYLGPDSYPVIVPLLQCRAANDRQLFFSPIAYKQDLANIPSEADVAVLALSMNATSVLVRGKFRGISGKRMIPVGGIDIDWVYNSMPPVPGQVYPPTELKPVTSF